MLYITFYSDKAKRIGQNMKRSLLPLILVLFFVGCQSKNNVINLYSYNAMPKVSTSLKSVYIEGVKDSRTNDNLVGVIKANDGSIKEYVVLENDLSLWLKDAITKELNSIGISVKADPSVDASVLLDIKEFSAVLEGFDKDNLKASANVEVIVTKGNTIIKNQVSQKQSEFVVMKKGSAFSPFMQNLLNDIVKKSAQQIKNSI